MRVRVRVPCSTSNLGAGFDCIGLALNRYLTATLDTADTPLHIERSGTLDSLVDEGDDLVAAAMRQAGCEPRGTLTLSSEIPVGRGLGSSAAATVAGLMLAARVNAADVPRESIAAQAAMLEGHPDNAVPAAYGGLVAAMTETADGVQKVRVHRLRLSPHIRFVYAAPQAIVATKAARRALPEHIPHAVATRSIARTVALLEGLADGDPELLRIGFADELHVPFRLPMIPGGQHVWQAALDAGAWAVTISGSGSGMIAACARGTETDITAAMRAGFEQATADDALAFVIEPDVNGAQYIE